MVDRTRTVVFVVVTGLVAALLALAPVVPAPPASATETGFFADGTEMRVDITAPVDGSSAPGGETNLTGTARVGGGDTAADTSVVVVIDNSNSTTDATGVDCDGNGTLDNIFVCEKAAVVEFITGAAEVGSVSEIALIRFSGSASLLDARPDLVGVQAFAGPGDDRNANGTSDLVDVLMPLGRSGGTRYDLPIQLACSTLAGSSQPNKYVVFLSDGENASGVAPATLLPCPGQPDVAFHTFAVGRGAGCALVSGNRGSLQDIADLTGGTCTNVSDPSVLRDLLDELVRPEIIGLSVSLNGGPPIDLAGSVTPPLPVQGPQEVSFERLIDGLTGPVDELCVTAVGRRGTEQIEVTDCVELVSNRGPVADAGDDVTVAEGGVVRVDGSASSDPDGDPLSYAWTLVGQDGPPVVLTSTATETLAFQAPDDGTYTFELTVSDGRASSSDRVTVTVANANPIVTAAAEPAAEGGVALVTASFTDAGYLDLHAASIDWGDGSPLEAVPVATQGTGWGTVVASHVYAGGGSFSATVTVTDDDGGTGTSAVAAVAVTTPLGVWANRAGAGQALTVTGSGTSITGATHSNGGLKVTGSNKTFVGPTTVAGSTQVSGSNNTFTPPIVAAPVAAPPVVLALDDYRPGGRAAVDAGPAFFDMTAACGNKWRPTTTLAPGLYWVPCDVQVSGQQFSAGPVTIATTGEVQVSGSAQQLFEPFIDGALFVSGRAGNNAIQVSGSASLFSGYLHALAGEIQITGSSHTFFCGMLADTIRISGSNTAVRAADCARPARSTADPLLIPSLTVGVAQAPTDVAPGQTLTDAISVAHTGAAVAIPGIAGIQNLGTAATTVTAATVAVQRFDVATARWVDLEAPVTVTARPNAAAGVTPPAGGGFIGTQLAGGAYATWAVQAAAVLTPAQLTALLDPAVTGGVRVVIDLGVDPAAPVRQLARFSSDLAPALRAQGADLAAVEVTLVAPDGAVTVSDAATEPALGTVAPGASVALSSTSDVATVEPVGAAETAAAYAARLAALDDSGLTAVAFATGTAGVGRIVAPQAVATSIRRVPVLDPSLVGPASAAAGDDIGYLVGVTNRGSTGAVAIDTTATVDGQPAAIDGLPSELAAGGVIVGSIAHTIPADRPAGDLDTATTFRWADAAGNAYGPVHLDTTTDVGTAARLRASLADTLLVDADGNALPSPGDTIAYTATITNLGDNPATGVTFTLPTDPHGVLDPASVTTTAGTITSGTTPGDTTVTVDVGTIAPSSSAEIAFATVAANPLPAGVSRLSVQGTVAATTPAGSLLTDDPGTFGAANPTVTQLVLAEPAAEVTLTDVLAIDADQNGAASPGDTLRYHAHVLSVGNTPIAGVAFTLTPGTDTALVAGSVDASGGTVTTGNGPGDTSVVVDVGVLAAGADADIVFEATIAGAATAPTVANQATLTGTNLPAPVRSDDPDTPALADATVTSLRSGGEDPVNTGPGITGCSPADGQAITEPTALTCAITPRPGTTVTDWTVTIGRPDGEGTRTIAEGTGDPTVPLATIDPTELPNGTWIVTITVADDGDGESEQQIGVIVEGQLKLGRYRVTHQDMAVPVGGIPIQVLRTYDSFSRDTVGDFGHGWSLDVSDFRVDVHRPLGLGGWEQYQCGGGFIFVEYCFRTTRAHYVSVTWPDGRVETFDFTPDGLSSFFGSGAIAKYTGRPNTTSKLKPALGDTNLGWAGTGDLTTDPFGAGHDVYDPTRFVLVGRDGTEYTLDREDGLVAARDRRDNTVTIDDAGIHSSDGPDITFERDALGRLESVTGPDATTVEYRYDAAGDLDQVTDQAHQPIALRYEDHYLLESVGPDSTRLRTVHYDTDGRVDAITDADGRTTTFDLDLTGRSSIAYAHDGRGYTQTTYDSRGNATRVDEVFDGEHHAWDFEFDSRDAPTMRRAPNGAVNRVTYDARGNPTVQTDANLRTTTTTFNTYGQPTVIEDARGEQVRFTYHPSTGDLTAMTDPDGKTRTYAYAAPGRVSSTSDGVHPATTFTYDAQGRLATRTDGNHDTTTFEYDTAGRVTVQHRPEGDVRFVYDDLGQRTAMVDQTGTTTYDHDDLGRLTQIASPQGTVTYGYDGTRRTSMTTPAGTFTYGYDTGGRLSSMTGPAGVVSFTHTFGGVDTITRPNGVTTTNGYDPAGQLTDIVHARAGAPLAEFHYALDPKGNRTGVTQTVDGATWQETYQLDEVDRLTDVTYSDTGEHAVFGYSPAGHRRSMTVTGTGGDDGTTTYGYDDAQQLTSLSFGPQLRTPSYDGNGNQVDDGAGSTFGYDSANQLVTVNGARGAHLYTYNGDGLRVVADGVDQLWDAAASLPALIHDGTTTQSYAGDLLVAQTAGGVSTFPLHDALGSTRLVTDGGGAVVGTQRFDVYGAPRGVTGTASRFAYSGQHTDASGLVHLRARDYDPTQGRFLTADGVQPNAYGTQGYNLYGYAAGNPTTHVDPAGESILGGYAKLLDRSSSFVENAAYIGIGLALLIGFVAFEPCANIRSNLRKVITGAVVMSLVHAVLMSLGAPNSILRAVRVAVQAGLPSANGANFLIGMASTGVYSC